MHVLSAGAECSTWAQLTACRSRWQLQSAALPLYEVCACTMCVLVQGWPHVGERVAQVMELMRHELPAVASSAHQHPRSHPLPPGARAGRGHSRGYSSSASDRPPAELLERSRTASARQRTPRTQQR